MSHINRALVLAAAVTVSAAAGAAAQFAITPFDGKSLQGWKLKGDAARSKWVVGKATMDPQNPAKVVVMPATGGETALVNSAGGGVDIYSEQKFGGGVFMIDVMVPKGSNSGIYVMGEYEIQVLDSHGKSQVGPGDIGGLYGAAAPKLNAAKPPGEWQRFEIHFTAPKFEGERKVANAKFRKVLLNGMLIHENVEMNGPTPGGLTGKEAPTGPLMFQGDHGPVAYRNIRVVP